MSSAATSGCCDGAAWRRRAARRSSSTILVKVKSVGELGSLVLNEHHIILGFAASRHQEVRCRTLTLHSHLWITFSLLDPFLTYLTRLTDAQEQRRGSPRRVRARLALGRRSAGRSCVGGGLPTRPRVPGGGANARDGVACLCYGCGASGAVRGALRARCDPVLNPYSPCCPRASGDSRSCHGEQ